MLAARLHGRDSWFPILKDKIRSRCLETACLEDRMDLWGENCIANIFIVTHSSLSRSLTILLQLIWMSDNPNEQEGLK
jgi:hypothetical protein